MRTLATVLIALALCTLLLTPARAVEATQEHWSPATCARLATIYRGLVGMRDRGISRETLEEAKIYAAQQACKKGGDCLKPGEQFGDPNEPLVELVYGDLHPSLRELLLSVRAQGCGAASVGPIPPKD